VLGHIKLATVATGFIVFVILAIAGFTWFVKSGWMAKLTPPLPIVEPLKLRIHGSPIIVRGVTNVYTAEIAGPAGNIEWKVIPTTGGTLRPLTDGHSAEFSTLNAGNVTIAVMVAGQGLQIASDQLDVEVVDFTEKPSPEEPPPSPDMPPPPPPSTNNPPPPPQPQQPQVVSMAEYVNGALLNVVSPDRGAEARHIAGTISTIIGQLQTAQLPPDTDIPALIEQQASAALGDRANNWSNFFIALRIAFDVRRQQGIGLTAAGTLPDLMDMTAVLRKAN
jgi:hypothetical protein